MKLEENTIDVVKTYSKFMTENRVQYRFLYRLSSFKMEEKLWKLMKVSTVWQLEKRITHGKCDWMEINDFLIHFL